jgi:Ca2+-binding EF-hand superfamily protein
MGTVCSSSASAPEAEDVPPASSGKAFKEWSADEVKATLKVFKDFDKDNSGFIDASELKSLCDVLGITALVSEADTLTKDGKIDPKEFFVWYVGCTVEDAAAAFAQHNNVFAALTGKALKEWSADEVKATMKVFTDFDKDNSGFIDAAELKSLCDVLGITARVSEADTLTKDGKIDPKEFFVWYCGCTVEEAAAAFAQHNNVFAALTGKALKEWSADEVKGVMKVFKDFDKDSSGFIDAVELKGLCDVLGISARVSDADTLTKDGKIDRKEFFAWYVGCTAKEAAETFEKHKSIFGGRG